MKYHLCLVLLASLPLLHGCVTIVDATTTEPIKTEPGRRTFGDKWDDRNLRTITAVNLRKASEELDKAHINVHCFNQVILLTGEVPTKAAYELAGKTARAVANVRQVYNELQIEQDSHFMSRVNDEYLELKINSKLVSKPDIDSGRLKVIVEDEVVYLMGTMTMAEAEKVTDIVASSGGIEKVVRAIEYIE